MVEIARPTLGSTPLRLAVLGILLILYFAEWQKNDLLTSDFAAFYTAATLWEDGWQPFSRDLQCEIQSHIGGSVCLPFFHPPVLLPLLSLVSTENYSASYLRWVGVLLIILITCALPIRKLISCDVLDIVLYLTFFPIFALILQGQDTAFVLLGILMAAVFLRDRNDILAGIALSLVVLRPHLALALAIPLTFCRPKAFLSFFIAGVVLVAYSLALVGVEGFNEALKMIVLAAKGADPTIRQAEMYNLVGLFVRLGISSSLAWALFAAAIVGISILWRKRGVTQSNFALGVLSVLFTSPHLHAHDLSLLIIPMLSLASIMTPVISLAFMAAILLGVQHVFVYALMLTLALSLTKFRGFTLPGPQSSLPK